MATRTSASEIAPDAEPAIEASEAVDPARKQAAEGMIKNYVIASVGVAIVPVPLFDIAAVVAIQLRMVQKLSQHYDKPFSEKLGRSVIASLAGGILGVGIGGMAGSLMKAVPGIGWAIGMVSVPAFAGASTYAIGQTFIKHYEEGGSLLDLDAAKLKDYYRRQFKRGKQEAEEAVATTTAG